MTAQKLLYSPKFLNSKLCTMAEYMPSRLQKFRILIFIVLFDGINCITIDFSPALQLVWQCENKVKAPWAWPGQAHIGVHTRTKIIEGIVLVRAVGGAVVGLVGLVRDGVRGVWFILWSRWWWWTSHRPWQWQPPVVSMVVSFPNTRLHFFWQVFDDLSSHVAPTIANPDSERGRRWGQSSY